MRYKAQPKSILRENQAKYPKSNQTQEEIAAMTLEDGLSEGERIQHILRCLDFMQTRLRYPKMQYLGNGTENVKGVAQRVL
jgi:hypothetical protein